MGDTMAGQILAPSLCKESGTRVGGSNKKELL